MSFGYSVGDLVLVLDLANKLRKRFRDAPAQFKAVSDDVKSLSTVIRNLDDTLPERDLTTTQEEDLTSCTETCRNVLVDLNKVINRYQEVEKTAYGFRSKTRRVWKRVEWDSAEIQKLRSRLTSSIGILNTVFSNINSVTLESIRNGIDRLNNHQEEIKALIALLDQSQLPNEIRYWLRAPDANVDYREACDKSYPNSGRWLVDSSAYTTWLKEPNSFLWLNGFAGCGKSVLCATAIRSAFNSSGTAPEVGIAFFYFSFKDDSKQVASSMLRALIFQLSTQANNEYMHLKELRTQCARNTPSVSAMMGTLQSLIQCFQDVHIFVDAIDECPHGIARDEALQCLEDLHEASISGLHLLITSRDVYDIRTCVQSFGKNIPMKNEGVDKDIADFISGRLQNSRKLQKWLAYHELIKKTLMSRADGVFRWVECQFISLASCPSSKTHLKSTLASLPRSLDETYEKMLLNIDEENIKDAKRILTFLCCAKRPMTLNEIVDAIAVELEDGRRFNNESRFQDPEDVLRICPGLIDISHEGEDESNVSTDKKLRIAHFSVQEYLESERVRQHKSCYFSLQSGGSHNEIAQILLVYLLDTALSAGQLQQDIFSRRPLLHYAAQHWYYHYHQAEGDTKLAEELAMELLQKGSNNFLNWVRVGHQAHSSPNLEKTHDEISDPIYYISEVGLSSLLSRLLSTEQQKFRSSSRQENGIFCWDNDKEKLYGNALQAASAHGHTRVVQILLDYGADVNTQGGRYGNALQAASLHGRDSIVQILLERGAHVNKQGGRYGNALQAASAGGSETIVQILLDNGAKVNAQGGYYRNALYAASTRGHTEIVQILLDKGADTNSTGPDGGVLAVALHAGHEEIAKLLLMNGADVNSKSSHGSALEMASLRGLSEAVQLLVDHGADVHVKGEKGSALDLALSDEGYREALAQLSRKSTDEDPKQLKDGLKRYEKVIKILRRAGAERNDEIRRIDSLRPHKKMNQTLLNPCH